MHIHVVEGTGQMGVVGIVRSFIFFKTSEKAR